jgi:hypothetical protein
MSKNTTAATTIRRGTKYLGDDYCIFDASWRAYDTPVAPKGWVVIIEHMDSKKTAMVAFGKQPINKATVRAAFESAEGRLEAEAGRTIVPVTESSPSGLIRTPSVRPVRLEAPSVTKQILSSRGGK